MHALTDGRDVSERSALTWITPLEAELAALPDAAIASGGGRMRITMDRYEADWAMVQRGWNAHVRGVARPFLSATAAIEAMYAEDPKTNDQLLDAFVVVDGAGVPRGTIRDGDAVVLFNFRGDRAIEISRAFVGEVPFNRGKPPSVTFAGMMLYDGDTQLPPRYLVEPPAIGNTVGEQLVRAGLRTFAVSETQKFGHVTYFFNGNRSGRLCASAVTASVYIASPLRIAADTSHRAWTVGCPRRSGASSMMSSCIRVKLWNSSTATAAGRAAARSPSASAATRVSTGRNRFPPSAIK